MAEKMLWKENTRAEKSLAEKCLGRKMPWQITNALGENALAEKYPGRKTPWKKTDALRGNDPDKKCPAEKYPGREKVLAVKCPGNIS